MPHALRMRSGADGFSMQRRPLIYALAASIGLHMLALAELPSFDFDPAVIPAEAPLQVTVLTPAQRGIVTSPARPAQPQAKLKPQPQHRAKRRPAPAPEPAASPAPIPVAPIEPVLLAAASAEPQPSGLVDPAALTEATTAADTPLAEQPPAPAPAAYPVRAARLVFDLYYGESGTLVGEVVQTWQLTQNHYVAESAAEAVGFASLFLGGRYVQRSEGELGPTGFIPHRYTVQDRRKPQPEQAEFDWTAGEVRFTRRGKASRAPLEPGTQDPLSAVHQLQFMRPLPPGVMLQVATTRRVEAMLFQNMGEEEVATARGPVAARHVKREERDGSITEVWLDPARAFLPVRIRTLNRNGYLLDQRLREMRITRVGDADPAPAAELATEPGAADGPASPADS
jgi:hypothetical protein